MEKLWISKYPGKVFLYPSLLCNLHCNMCYSGGHSEIQRAKLEDLSLDCYKQLIDDLYRFGIRLFDISGGEPFLREDLVEICKYIKKYEDTKIYLVSNGTLIKKKEEMVLECMQYVDLLKISLDSTNATKHNEIRNSKNAYEQTQAGIQFLLDHGYSNIGINFVVMDTNVDDVCSMLDYAYEKGLSCISLLRFIDVSPHHTLRDENLELDRICKLVVTVKEWIDKKITSEAHPFDIVLVLPGYSLIAVNKVYKNTKYDGIISYRIEYDPIRGCPAFGDSLVITNTGMVTGCTGMMSESQMYIGDIKTQPLEEIYAKLGDIRKQMREREVILKSKEPCSSCEYWAACRGGCPAAAVRYRNDFNMIDPTCCKSHS